VRSFWLFCHLLGVAMWIGGGLAAMFASIAGNKLDRSHQAVVARLVAAIYGRVLAPGAALNVLSGALLSLAYMGAMNRGDIRVAMSPWLMVMQGAGVLGAALVLMVALPAVNRLTRLDPVGQAEAFDAFRRRQRVAGMIATTFAFVGLLAAAMYR
jgi:hypothetical protein